MSGRSARLRITCLDQSFVVEDLLEIDLLLAFELADRERLPQLVGIHVQVALGELVPLPRGQEAQPVVDVVDDHGGGQERMPGLTLEPVDAQGPQPTPVVQIAERLPRQFRGGIEAMVDLAEGIVSSGPSPTNCSARRYGFSHSSGKLASSPLAVRLASENPLDLIGPQIEPGNQIAEQPSLFERFRFHRRINRFPSSGAIVEPGIVSRSSVEEGKEFVTCLAFPAELDLPLNGAIAGSKCKVIEDFRHAGVKASSLPQFGDQGLHPRDTHRPVLGLVAQITQGRRLLEQLLDEHEGLVVGELTGGVLEVPGVLRDAEELRQEIRLIEVEMIGEAESLIGIMGGDRELPTKPPPYFCRTDSEQPS